MLLVLFTLLFTFDAAVIEFQPSTKYVKPGTDFHLKCSSDTAASIKIFSPGEIVPPADELQRINAGFTYAEKTTTINDYFSAKDGDSGLYTCLVMHGSFLPSGYTIGHIEVVVVELCDSINCEESESCESDYDTGTAECTCPADMCDEFLRVFDPLCSDTCEQFFNDCHMKETTCRDKKARIRILTGFCPATVRPTIRQQNLDITASKGEVIQLHSGLVADSVPESSITWSFTPKDGVKTDVDGGVVLGITAEQSGVYNSKITHCKDDLRSVGSTYNIIVEDPDVFTQPPTPVPSSDSPPTNSPLSMGICGIYNNGVIEMFDGEIVQRALNCHHVLVADPEHGWFIYGKFTAESHLESISIYASQTVFEIQRGWVINVHGEKLFFNEGEVKVVGDCSILFENLHLHVTCPLFKVLYDGIKMGYIDKVSDLNGSLGGLGLCYGLYVPEGYSAGVNWQVGNTAAPCLLPEVEECTSSDDTCDNLTGKLYTACTCAIADDQCELVRASMVRTFLQGKGDMTDEVDACPDVCAWKDKVVAGGCPQPDASFLCNIT